MAFDTATYPRRLQVAGFSRDQAEGLAEANHEALLGYVATKSDIGDLRADLNREIASVRSDMKAMEARLDDRIESAILRQTVRLGVMLGAGITALGVVLRMH